MGRMLAMVLALTALALPSARAGEVTRTVLDRLTDSTVHGWRFKPPQTPGGETAGAESPEFDDSSWERVDVGHQWWPHESTCWFRTWVAIPERINGAPVAGATVRMKLGMDNEADAYVNGAFRQHFKWADGDIVLAENARPGDRVCVALRGINHPGYGSLYQAYLVSSASEPLVNALKGLLHDFDVVLSYEPFCVPDTSAHWHKRMYEAMQTLDLAAYHAGDRQAFLASVEQARAALVADTRQLEARLRAIGEESARLRGLIARGRKAGLDMAYPRLDARVIESFMNYAQDDVKDGAHTIRALRTAEYLEAVSRESLAEATAILADPKRDRSVPAYKTGPVAIRDGAFRQNERPLFFTGVGHFDQVRKDVPILTEYGLNIIQIEKGPNSVLPTQNTVTDAPIREDLLPVLDNAAAHNVMVNLLISPHYFPQWVLDQNPALADCGYGFMKHCVDAPESRGVYEKYLRTLMPLIANHPALHSICLSNEPQYQGFCAHSAAMFHRWLEARYGTIDKANAVYATAFGRFEDVPMAKDSAHYALFYDTCVFNQDRFLQFHRFLADLVHEYDPDLPVHAKVMSHAFRDPGAFEVGINYEDFTRLDRIAGNDCVQTFEGERPGEYVERWQDMALNYTIQHCVAPDSPIFNSEDHIISDGDWRFIPEGHIRTAYWMQAMHGQGAATTWVWERGQGGDLSENILTRANCVRALGRVVLDLNRLAPEVHALQQARAEWAILYAFSSFLPSPVFALEASAAFEGGYFADTVCDFVTERQASEGGLGRYKLVVAPCTSHVPDDVFRALQDYVASGGALMTVGECFTRDEHGRPRATTLQAPTSSGRLVVYPDRLTARAYREILDRLLDSVGCGRPVRLTGVHGEPIWGVNLRAVPYNGKRLVNLMNLTREDQTVFLRAEPLPEKVLNLFDYDEVILPLTLKPLDPLLLTL